MHQQNTPTATTKSSFLISDIEAIILDVEGTTTPIDFVYKVLFPFASQHLESFITDAKNKELIASDLELLKKEFDADTGKPLTDFNPIEYLQYLISIDRKSPALKSLQGKIWEAGYKSGEIKGEVFDEIPDSLRRWRSSGYKTYIYSSGSVLAQKLLFGHSTKGNLQCDIFGHFDTGVGAKTDPTSYTNIANKILVAPEKCLFVSDAPAELKAAQQAGMKVLFSNRPGNIHKNEDNYPEVSTFDF
jgi:enolase-phosphatase E1